MPDQPDPLRLRKSGEQPADVAILHGEIEGQQQEVVQRVAQVVRAAEGEHRLAVPVQRAARKARGIGEKSQDLHFQQRSFRPQRGKEGLRLLSIPAERRLDVGPRVGQHRLHRVAEVGDRSARKVRRRLQIRQAREQDVLLHGEGPPLLVDIEMERIRLVHGRERKLRVPADARHRVVDRGQEHVPVHGYFQEEEVCARQQEHAQPQQAREQAERDAPHPEQRVSIRQARKGFSHSASLSPW